MLHLLFVRLLLLLDRFRVLLWHQSLLSNPKLCRHFLLPLLVLQGRARGFGFGFVFGTAIASMRSSSSSRSIPPSISSSTSSSSGSESTPPAWYRQGTNRALRPSPTRINGRMREAPVCSICSRRCGCCEGQRSTRAGFDGRGEGEGRSTRKGVGGRSTGAASRLAQRCTSRSPPTRGYGRTGAHPHRSVAIRVGESRRGDPTVQNSRKGGRVF